MDRFKNNQSIYKGEEQIPGYIFSVGFDNNFIIAKRHPLKGDFYSEPDFSVTNYYIIDLAENKKGYRKGVIGPLSEAEFYIKRNKLEIKGRVNFTIEE